MASMRAIGIPGDVEYDYRVFVGDRALVGRTGMPGFPFPFYQPSPTSIRQSGLYSVTKARASTREWALVCLTHNLLKLFRHRLAKPGIPAPPALCRV